MKVAVIRNCHRLAAKSLANANKVKEGICFTLYSDLSKRQVGVYIVIITSCLLFVVIITIIIIRLSIFLPRLIQYKIKPSLIDVSNCLVWTMARRGEVAKAVAPPLTPTVIGTSLAGSHRQLDCIWRARAKSN